MNKFFSISLHNFSNKSIGKVSFRIGQEKHVGERVGRKKRETPPNVCTTRESVQQNDPVGPVSRAFATRRVQEAANIGLITKP